MKNSAEPTFCFHCGLPVADKLNITVKYNGKDEPMCCYGCQAVAQAIIDSGMDDFYKYRTSTAEKPEEIVPEFLQQLKAYDNHVVQKKFVHETNDKTSSGKALEVSLILEGITCAACVWLNEKHLNSLEGVIDANINYSNHRARVRWDNSKIQLSDILESISRIGYLAHPYDPEQHQRILEKERKQQIKRLGLSGLLGMQVMIFAVAMYTGEWWGIDESFKQSFRWISLVTLRHAGKLHHIGIGRTHARTHITMLIKELEIHIIDTNTGEILRHLTLNPNNNYQPQQHNETPKP